MVRAISLQAAAVISILQDFQYIHMPACIYHCCLLRCHSAYASGTRLSLQQCWLPLLRMNNAMMQRVMYVQYSMLVMGRRSLHLLHQPPLKGLSKHKLSVSFWQTKKVLHFLISRVDPKTDRAQISAPACGRVSIPLFTEQTMGCRQSVLAADITMINVLF